MMKTDPMCKACVYYPPNLPESMYSKEDWLLLQGKECSFDAVPGDGMCQSMRKGSCSIVKLDES